MFLGQEVERRRGNTQLLVAVTDSLILWSLEGTDPDAGTFRTRDEILTRIESALPSAGHFIRGVIDDRLGTLSKKGGANGREIRFHRKQSGYCLPFETRRLIYAENTEDEALKASVTDVFRRRLIDALSSDGDTALVATAIEACHRTLSITFEKQGLEIAYFVSSNEPDSKIQSSVSENMDRALLEMKLGGNERDAVKAMAMPVIRRAFYDSTDVERAYLSKLSRTYALLFVLKNEPRVVEYFQNMSSKFVLYVGADLIVRAISERYLRPEDRMTWNVFKILAGAGSKLILTEVTLQEVLGHLVKADRDFRADYLPWEPRVNLDLARHINQILIRAYFYARLNPEARDRRPAGWSTFVGQFCTYADLHEPEGLDSLRRSLCEEFGFTYEDETEMRKGIDPAELTSLASRIATIRQRQGRGQGRGKSKEAEEMLAANDALHILRVYALRQQLGETKRANPYGFQTWWLTQETQVKQATAELVRRKGSPFMRPEFLLNFIALTPSLAAVRQSFETIFPSLLGVRLSNRMRDEVFKIVVGKVKEANQLSDARARALVSELSDRLKGDHYKEYEAQLTTSGHWR